MEAKSDHTVMVLKFKHNQRGYIVISMVDQDENPLGGCAFQLEKDKARELAEELNKYAESA